MKEYRVHPCDKPHGLFPSVNFMTGSVRGYFRLREGFAELSTGEFRFPGRPVSTLWGVTCQNRGDKPGLDKRSKCCDTRAEAMQYIASLS